MITNNKLLIDSINNSNINKFDFQKIFVFAYNFTAINEAIIIYCYPNQLKCHNINGI